MKRPPGSRKACHIIEVLFAGSGKGTSNIRKALGMAYALYVTQGDIPSNCLTKLKNTAGSVPGTLLLSLLAGAAACCALSSQRCSALRYATTHPTHMYVYLTQKYCD